jgi:hypothetical protein
MPQVLPELRGLTELRYLEVATMTHLVFTVVLETTGWFVHGADRLGPFFSRQRAMDLAEGMVTAIRATGEDAELVVEPRTWSSSSAAFRT